MLWERKLERYIAHWRSRASIPLQLQLWNGQQFSLFDAQQTGCAILRIQRPATLKHLWKPTLGGLGSAYVEGDIDIEGHLPDVMQAAWSLVEVANQGKSKRTMHFARHSRRLDKKAIEYHYDVGNDFYRLWLDEQMVYSCAYFEHGDETLAQAQIKKMDHILRKLNLQPGERLLDVGCGWGALAIRAAQQYGASVYGITLSQQQYEFATQRIQTLGLQDKVRIEIRDYRDLLPEFSSYFDKISSIGMFEHVGLKNLALYFSTLKQLLKAGGLVLNHGITSTDPGDGETPYAGGDFIHRYVFPHGELVHISTVLREMQKGGLEVCDVESLRRHYAQTLSFWSERFEANAEQARHLAGERRFRIWRLYLAACAQAFQTDWISLFQILACHAGGGQQNPLPGSRRYQYL